MAFKPINTAPAIAKKNRRWLRLQGENEITYYTIGYWNGHDWIEIGTQGGPLVGVTHWAPFS